MRELRDQTDAEQPRGDTPGRQVGVAAPRDGRGGPDVQAVVESALEHLDLYRHSRVYRFGQFLSSLRSSPLRAAATAAAWTCSSPLRRRLSLLEALSPPDALRTIAVQLRSVARFAAPPEPADTADTADPPEWALLVAFWKRASATRLGDLLRRRLPEPVRDALRQRLLPTAPSTAQEYRACASAIESLALAPRHAILARHAEALARVREAVASAKGVVVYLPTLNWGYLFQRPQQLIRELARAGYVCIFCCATPSEDGVDGFKEVEPNLFLCSDVRLALEFERPVVWLNWPLNASYLPLFRRPRVVYEFIDELEVFHLHCSLLERDHEELVAKADVVTASADRLLERIRARRPDALLVPNAVNPEDFRGGAGERAVPTDLVPALARNRPIVGYYGALARWLDYDLINRVTGEADDLTFVFLGPDHDGTARRLRARDNVFALGPKPYHELSKYSSRFAVATIPFRVDAVTRSTSPVKLFEFMTMGLPIVTTAMDECMKYRSVLVAHRRADFLPRIREALALRDDAAYLAQVRRDAEANTWSSRVAAILAALSASEAGEATAGHQSSQLPSAPQPVPGARSG